MGGRSRTTFTKLQKERARQEKQREKAARKQQRKTEGGSGLVNGDIDLEHNSILAWPGPSEATTHPHNPGRDDD
jgi:hypothetical protein